MSHPLEMWSDRIAAAESEQSRRTLLAELAVFRARNLSDVSKSRRATFSIARLHQMVEDRDQAVQEARSLVSLCRTPPEATSEEVGAVQELLRSLGEAIPQLKASGGERERRPRGRERERERERRERPPKERAPKDGLQVARRAAGAGDWAAATRALDGVKGASAHLLRAYLELSAALEAPEADRTARLTSLQGSLQRVSGVRGARPAAPVLADDPVSALLDAPVPARRAARLRAIDRWVQEHPDRADEMAEACLARHLALNGPDAAAPWLVGVVGSALARGDAPRTRATIEQLRASGAIAVAAYDEWPFSRLIRLETRALARELEVGGLRRGVAAREEPEERKLWTLRLTIGGVPRMIVVGAHLTDPYADGLAPKLAERIRGLCPHTLLLATGSGNEALRIAAAGLGVTVLEQDGDDDSVLDAVAAIAGSPPAPERGPSPANQLAEALQAEPVDPAAVLTAVQAFRRPDRAMRPVLKLELGDAQVAALLGAVHQASEPDAPIPEGTTVAVRAAVAGELTRALLLGDARDRFGGPGVDAVIQVAQALVADGWHIHRVLRGPTRREGKDQPAIQTLSGALMGLWRLLVRKDDRRGEVWFVAALPVEGRAAVPLLLVADHGRVVVLDPDPDLSTWWASLPGAPSPILWTGDEAQALQAAAGALPAVAAQAPG